MLFSVCTTECASSTRCLGCLTQQTVLSGRISETTTTTSRWRPFWERESMIQPRPVAFREEIQPAIPTTPEHVDASQPSSP